MTKRLTLNAFVQKANKIHSHKYDYSLTEYKNNKTKIIIRCVKCSNLFEQTPDSHLRGRGCAKCSQNKKYSNIEFILQANKIHKNKYDYSLVKYKNSYTKITIVCPKHKIFTQKPGEHLNGKGCKKCGIEKRGNALLLSIDKFISKANKIHNNRYDYSLTEYTNSRTKIKIICSKHGVFKQIPNSHLNGNGCPACRSSKGEKMVVKFLQQNGIKFETQKTFDDCKNVFKLRFDFYLPEKNILIEYDGKQHFGLGWSKYKEGFKNIKKNDRIKNSFAKRNKIKLVRIPYTKLNKIEEILSIMV
jgi:very-short-patch-repair endonuclease